VNLVDILKAMDASGEKLPDEKNDSEVKKIFSKKYTRILISKEVYNSDLKK